MLRELKRFTDNLFPAFPSDKIQKEYDEEMLEKLPGNMSVFAITFFIISSFRILTLTFSGLSCSTNASLIGLMISLDIIYYSIARWVRSMSAQHLERKKGTNDKDRTSSFAHIMGVTMSVLVLIVLVATRTYTNSYLRVLSLHQINTMFILSTLLVIPKVGYAITTYIVVELFEVIIPFPSSEWLSLLAPTMVANAMGLFLWLINEGDKKVNFLLREEVKEQRKLYMEFFESLRSPSVMLSEHKVIKLNKAASDFGITPENFWEFCKGLRCGIGKTLYAYLKEMRRNKKETFIEKYPTVH